MNKFNLYIYSLETIQCIISDTENNEIKTIDFKNEYDSFNITYSDCLTQENINKNIKFILFDRDRDENGNVIKNNNFIDKYNTFLAVINDQSMARNLQNRYDRYIKYNNLMNNLSNSRTSLSNNLLNMFMPVSNNQPQTEEQPHQTEEQSPQTEEQPHQTEEQPPQTEEQPPQTEEQPPQTEEQSPQTNNNMDTNLVNMFNNLYSSLPNNSGQNIMNEYNNMSTRRFTLNSSNITDISENPQLTYEFTINSIFPSQYSTGQSTTQPSGSNYNQNVNNLYTSFFNLINSRFNIPAQQMSDVKMILTTEELDKLEIMKYKEYKYDLEEGAIVDDNSKCPISLQKFEDEDKIIKLKCGHIFKEEYIKEWLSESSNKCPVCREEIAKGKPNQEVNTQ